MVKTSPSNAGGAGSIPGQEVNIPHDVQVKNQNIEKKKSSIVTNSITTLKVRKKFFLRKKNVKVNVHSQVVPGFGL